VQKNCRQCQQDFEITADDLNFLEHVSPVFNGNKELVPPPTLCPFCRMQRRLSWRNERKLYHRKCDATSKEIISIYSPDKPFRVFNKEYWWSDDWNPEKYGVEYDFSRPFFDQFQELMQKAPRVALLNSNCENSDYAHNATKNKDCYLLFCGSWDELCLYCYWTQNSTSCVDCSGVNFCEQCYECVDCSRCYQLFWSQNCYNCNDSQYLLDCVSCSNCMASVGLRNTSFRWLNKQLAKEEYENRLRRWKEAPGFREETAQAFEKLKSECVRPWAQQRMTENCSGDYIIESRDCHDCFDAKQSENCRYCQNVVSLKDSMDVTFFGYNTELIYDTTNVGQNSYHLLFHCFGYGSKECIYCDNVHYSDHCFGCTSLHHKQYHILNKQYTEEEYGKLVPKIIEQLRQSGQWGEFFDTKLSPFGYNETPAQEHIPLSKSEVLGKGWQWHDEVDEEPKVSKVISARDLPEDVDAIPDDIVNWAVKCDVTKRPFRIVKQELDFYRRMHLPVPHLHPDERHKRRTDLRNPRKLWNRECAKCGKPIETSYAPDRPEIVYCENCYLKEVY